MLNTNVESWASRQVSLAPPTPANGPYPVDNPVPVSLPGAFRDAQCEYHACIDEVAAILGLAYRLRNFVDGNAQPEGAVQAEHPLFSPITMATDLCLLRVSLHQAREILADLLGDAAK